MVVAPIVSGLRTAVAGGASAAAELLGGNRPRRRWSGNGRAWIELRILDGSRSAEYAAVVEETIGSLAGVERTQLNWPLSRLVVDLGENGPPVEQLAQMVDAIERVFAEPAHRREPSRESGPEKAGSSIVLDIPGDAAEVVNRVTLLAAKVTALGVSVALQAVRAPRLPRAFAAVTTFAEAQPDVRRIFERALGRSRADAVLALG